MPTAKAIHLPTNTLLASTDAYHTATIEGNIYFPTTSILIPLPGHSNLEAKPRLEKSKTHAICPWKGKSSYYSLVTQDGKTMKDVAWYYPEPKEKAVEVGVKGKVAWDRGVVRVVVE